MMKKTVQKVTSKDLIDFLNAQKKGQELVFYYDIETFSYNLSAEKPTQFDSHPWSFAVSYFTNTILNVLVLPGFADFFSCFKQAKESSGKAVLIAHNGNGYDHHFLRRALIDEEGLMPQTAFNKASLEHDHEVAYQQVAQRRHLLEKRIKSKTKLELDFQINKRWRFSTGDTVPITSAPLSVLGQKLYHAGLIDETYLKTDMDYDAFNLEQDLTPLEVTTQALTYFESMSASDLVYIENDVIILALAHRFYNQIYPGFDNTARTLTVNVVKAYTGGSSLAIWQILSRYSPYYKDVIDYTRYKWRDGVSFYRHLRQFYKGGLNHYNDDKLERLIKRDIFSIDLNSSYPNVMYHEQLPTYLSALTKDEKYLHTPNQRKLFYLIECDKEEFSDLLKGLFSTRMRKIFTRYYANMMGDVVYLNNVTIDLMNQFRTHPITFINARSVVTFECRPFAGRDQIFEFYNIKANGKSKHRIDFNTPTDYVITDELQEPISELEVANAKLLLNSLYGAPALRKYFNIFKYKDGVLENFQWGHENGTRQLPFAIAVTAFSLYNLLQPLTTLTASEIDRYFYYCDTDSLYLDRAVYDKVVKSTRIDPIALGAWDVEHDQINAFWIQNHKKYAFLENNEVTIKSGGVDVEAFDIFEKDPRDYKNGEKKIKRYFTSNEFETWAKAQFSAGSVIYNLTSVFNRRETITLYKRRTELSKAFTYLDSPVTPEAREVRDMVDHILLDLDDQENVRVINVDATGQDEGDIGLYLQTNLQDFGFEDLMLMKKDRDDTDNLPPAEVCVYQVQNNVKRVLE